MNNYRIYEQWVNKTKHWKIISTEASFSEFWKDYKRTLELMGMKLIAMIPVQNNNSQSKYTDH